MSRTSRGSNTKSLKRRRQLRASTANNQSKIFKYRVEQIVKKHGNENVTPEVIDNIKRGVKRAFSDSFESAIKDKFRAVVSIDKEKGTFVVDFEEK